MRSQRIRHIGIEPKINLLEIENSKLRKALLDFVNCKDSRNLGVYTENANKLLKLQPKDERMRLMEKVVEAARKSKRHIPIYMTEWQILHDALAALDACGKE